MKRTPFTPWNSLQRYFYTCTPGPPKWLQIETQLSLISTICPQNPTHEHSAHDSYPQVKLKHWCNNARIDLHAIATISSTVKMHTQQWSYFDWQQLWQFYLRMGWEGFNLCINQKKILCYFILCFNFPRSDFLTQILRKRKKPNTLVQEL